MERDEIDELVGWERYETKEWRTIGVGLQLDLITDSMRVVTLHRI